MLIAQSDIGILEISEYWRKFDHFQQFICSSLCCHHCQSLMISEGSKPCLFGRLMCSLIGCHVSWVDIIPKSNGSTLDVFNCGMLKGENDGHWPVPILCMLDMNARCACSVIKTCPTLCNLVDCSPPGSSVHELFQARMDCHFLLQVLILAHIKIRRRQSGEVGQNQVSTYEMRLYF